MSFLYPLFLIGAAAIAIPIVLHLIRRRTETLVEFSAVRLLEKAPVERQRRRRLRELILLALRVSALALLAIAFARPYIDRSSAALPASATVVALDTSMSLSAPGQFDGAREAARRAVTSAPATHTVALVTFSDAATIVVPATSDRGSVLAAIDAAVPTAGGTRYRTALGRAAEAIGTGEGHIVVVSDLQQVGWEASDEGAVPDGITIDVVEVAPPAGNVAVTAVRRDGQAVVAAVHNYGARPARVPVRLLAGNRDIVSQSVEVAAESAAQIRLTAPLPPRGGAEVRIDDPVGYQGDNVRYLSLDPPAAIPILVITSEPPGSSNAGLYIERALSVADEGRAFAPKVIDGRAFSALTHGQIGEPGALIVLGTNTLDRNGRETIAGFVRAGGRVLLALGPDTDLDTLSDTAGGPVDVDSGVPESTGRTVTIVAVDGRHPIFRPFLSPTGALGDVVVEQYRRLTDQPGRAVLARFSGAGSALTEQTIGAGRLLVFASDLENKWNRFPLNPGFVPWAIETARYLAHGRGQQTSYTLPDVPPGVTPAPGIYSVGAAGEVSPKVASGSGQAKADEVSPKPASGSEQAKADPPNRLIVVNPDVRESNPARTSVEEFTGAVTRLNQVAEVRAQLQAKEQEERQRLWQIGLIVMFLALAGEGFIGRKAT